MGYKILSGCLGWLFVVSVSVAGDDSVDLMEEYVLGDAKVAIESLMPGTERRFYLTCLEYQKSGNLEKADTVLFEWATAAGFTTYTPISPKYDLEVIFDRDEKDMRVFDRALFSRMAVRQAFLYYAVNPKLCLEYVSSEVLDLDFDEEDKAVTKAGITHPSALDPALISEESFKKHPHQHVAEAGAGDLAIGELPTTLRDHFLSDRKLPDVPGLMEWVLEELAEEGREFGDVKVHANLTLDQLKACAMRFPKLLGDGRFVEEYVSRLQPRALEGDAGWQRYLKDLSGFTKTLPQSMHALHATVMHAMLLENVEREIYDAALFEEYLKLSVPVMHQGRPRFKQPDKLPKPSSMELTSISSQTHARITDSHLRAFLKDAKDWRKYASYFPETVLKTTLAEVQLIHGTGNEAAHLKSLGLVRAEALKSRVELTLPSINPKTFGKDASVSLAIDVKHVDRLLVNVYRLNLRNQLLDTHAYPHASINVEGIQPTVVKSERFDASPMRRTRRKIAFPELKRPGAYLIEFIGGGKSCRALIIKGRLFIKSVVTTAGHRLTVFDENGVKRPRATIQFGTRIFESDKEGHVMIPFSRKSTSRTIIVSSDEVHSIATFEHETERYDLSANFFIPREALLAGRKCRLIVNPHMTVTGVRLPIELLQSPVLEVSYQDMNSKWRIGGRVEALVLKDRRELMLDVAVPPRVVAMRFRLLGAVAHIDGTTEELVASSGQYTFGEVRRTIRIRQSFVRSTPKGYELYVLGRNGEPYANVPVLVLAYKATYVTPIQVDLQTNESGVVQLGRLTGISKIDYSYGKHTDTLLLSKMRARGQTGWRDVSKIRHNYPRRVTIRKGTSLEVPFAGALDRRSVALMQMTSGKILHDHFKTLTLKNGMLRASALESGSYNLYLKRLDWIIHVTVVSGKTEGDFVLSGDTVYETAKHMFLRITDVNDDQDVVTIQTVGADSNARLHVIATRFLPVHDVMTHFPGYRNRPLLFQSRALRNAQYSRTRTLDPEYLYVLNRQRLTPFPGNMLARPGILLNPFDQAASRFDNFPLSYTGPMGGRSNSGRQRAVGKYGGSHGGNGSFGRSLKNQFSLDWLETPAPIIGNLIPDKDGVVRVPKKLLADCRHLTILAMNDTTATCRRAVLSPQTIKMRDLRLKEMITPGTRKAWTTKTHAMKRGESLNLRKSPGSKTVVVDSLASLYDWYLNSDSWRLREFRFLIDWPKMTEAAKLESYSKYVCHELNVFVYKKDRPFFDKYVKTYLLNKRDKTFMDDWLLGNDLSKYTELQRFNSKLNVMEKVFLANRIPDMRPVVDNHIRRQLKYAEPVEPELILFGMGFGKSPIAVVDLEEEIEEEIFEEEIDEEDVKEIRKARKKMKSKGFYALAKPVSVFVETHYYKRLLHELTAEFVPASAFWKEYLERDPKRPFLSSAIKHTINNSAEMIIAMALTDLPFTAKTRTVTVGNDVTRTFAGNAIVYHGSFQEVSAKRTASSLFMRQNYFDVRRRGKSSGDAEAPYYVTEFRRGRIYGCQLIISNPTQLPISIHMMAQLPIGSLPIVIPGDDYDAKTTVLGHLDLKSFETKEVRYHFYFPDRGEFNAYPAQALQDREIAASCKPILFKVKRPDVIADANEWERLAKKGTVQEIIEYLNAEDVESLNMAGLGRRLKEKETYHALVAWFKHNAIIDGDVFKFAFVHTDVDTITTLLNRYHTWEMMETMDVGSEFVSPLFSVHPFKDRMYEHMELDPVINPRAHVINGRRVLAGEKVREKYLEALNAMAYKKTLTDADKLEISYHLFLQDRVGDALKLFESVDRKTLTTKLQYDYFNAYALFYRSKVDQAEAVAKPYANYPITRWRDKFLTVLKHVRASRRIAGQTNDAKPDDAGAKDELAEPILNATVANDVVTIQHERVRKCSIGIYVMNLEFLFSKNPFISRDHKHFLRVAPNHVLPVVLKGVGTTTVAIPQKLRNKNLLIEVSGSGERVVLTSLASGLSLRVEENRGELKVVTKRGKPVSAAYVKVYALKNGKSIFYKDGYTDLRGRFDYASLNSTKDKENPIHGVRRFSVLVTTNTDGSLIREISLPTGLEETDVRPSEEW